MRITGGRRVRPCQPATTCWARGSSRPGAAGAHGSEAAAPEGDLIGLEAPPAPARREGSRRSKQREAARSTSPLAVDDRQQVEGLRQLVTAVASLGHDLNGRLGPEQGRRGRPGETPAGAAVVLAGTADRGDAHPHPVEAGLRHRGVERAVQPHPYVGDVAHALEGLLLQAPAQHRGDGGRDVARQRLPGRLGLEHLREDGAFSIAVTFSEPVNGFELADLVVGNGNASGLQGRRRGRSPDRFMGPSTPN